jgi:hypothetical protein
MDDCPHEISGDRSDVYDVVPNEDSATHVGACVRCLQPVFMKQRIMKGVP